MSYITLEEFKELGFDEVENFSYLRIKAEMAIDLFTNYFYQNNKINDDIAPRRKAVKLAIANQIAYMDASGVISAEDRNNVNSVTIGRTTINYNNDNKIKNEGLIFNLSLDSVNLLKSVGFGYQGVAYDR